MDFNGGKITYYNKTITLKLNKMTLLQQYQNAFKNLRTETKTSKEDIKLYVWSNSLLSDTIVKDVLEFNLDGSEKKIKSKVNLY
jgi:hypothetical protein